MERTVVPDVLTPAQAADLLQCSLNKVYRMLKAGDMPGTRFGASWRIVRTQLLAFLEGR